MIGGSYSGGVSFFKGLGEGRYASGKEIVTKDNRPLAREYAQAPCLADWDEDGDYDMAIGFIDGPVRLFLNNGDLTFSEAGVFKVDGKALAAQDGGPCISDWDGDGTLDLLMGDASGAVRFYKGTKTGSLELATTDDTQILPGLALNEVFSPKRRDAKSKLGFVPPRPGGRTKPFAADWNGDGKLDVLVGDYVGIESEPKKLSAAEQQELKKLEAQEKELNKRLYAAYERIDAAVRASLGIKDGEPLSDVDSEKMSEAFAKAAAEEKDFDSVQQELTKVGERLSTLRAEPEWTGLVWVYLRK